MAASLQPRPPAQQPWLQAGRATGKDAHDCADLRWRSGRRSHAIRRKRTYFNRTPEWGLTTNAIGAYGSQSFAYDAEALDAGSLRSYNS
jgi:hypothetical protein